MHIIPEYTDNNMKIESYNGRIKSLKDALLVLEGIRVGILPKIKRRLNGLEREFIRSNMVFAWNETECGIKRWTDGRTWSASKVSGPFLVYKELNYDKTSIKTNGLIKQSFSLTTKQNQKLHLIGYMKSNDDLETFKIPSTDPLLKGLPLDANIYQEYLLYYDQYLGYEYTSESEKKAVPGGSGSNLENYGNGGSDNAHIPQAAISASPSINTVPPPNALPPRGNNLLFPFDNKTKTMPKLQPQPQLQLQPQPHPQLHQSPVAFPSPIPNYFPAYYTGPSMPQDPITPPGQYFPYVQDPNYTQFAASTTLATFPKPHVQQPPQPGIPSFNRFIQTPHLIQPNLQAVPTIKPLPHPYALPTPGHFQYPADEKPHSQSDASSSSSASSSSTGYDKYPVSLLNKRF